MQAEGEAFRLTGLGRTYGRGRSPDAPHGDRVGLGKGPNLAMTFHGWSFIAGHTGARTSKVNRVDETCLTEKIDRDATRSYHQSRGTGRDRRPETCGLISRHDTGA